MDAADLARIPGVPEAALWPELVQRLPAGAPPAPWKCRVGGVVWLHRPGPDAAAALPEPLRRHVRPWLTVGGLLRFADSPVGPYAEVYGGQLLRGALPPRLNVAFMAVDSPASVYGGRVNWALPKTLASFTRTAGDAVRAEGRGWWVSVATRPLGLAVPAAAAVTGVQVWPDGRTRRFRTTLMGRCRPVRVEVAVDPGCSLPGWLLPGRHVAAQWAGTRCVVHPAEPAPPVSR